jgi:AAA+ ATPase superfamily predicted ATPase
VYSAQLDAMLKGNMFSTRLVEKDISSILKRTNVDGQYFILYGAKGAGKSLLVDHATNGHSGVIKLMVTSITTKDGIVKSLAKHCGVANETTPDIADFVTALSKGGSASKMLTVIFEVERGGTPDQAIGIHAVKSLAKVFATVSNCIIILSEANAVL